MKLKKLERNKGVAGLNVLLSLVTFLFLIGLIVMIFVIANAKLQTSIVLTADGTPAINETQTITDAGVALAANSNPACVATVSAAFNTSSGELINAGNYSVVSCTVTATAGSVYNNSAWNLSYSFTFNNNAEVVAVVNDTTTALSTTTDFFTTFITLGSLIVLVLLVVIIIRAVRGSGLTGDSDGNQSENKEGI